MLQNKLHGFVGRFAIALFDYWSETLSNDSVNSKRALHSPPGICHFVLEKLQMPHGRTWHSNKNLTVWGLKMCPNAPPQNNTKIIGHFRVPKTLTFKMRLGAQPFLWKRVLFAWEWNMISVSKAEHLPWYWNRGPGELENVLLLDFWHQNGAQFSRWLQLILIWKVSTQPQFESESFLIRSQGFLHALLGTRLWGFSRN